MRHSLQLSNYVSSTLLWLLHFLVRMERTFLEITSIRMIIRVSVTRDTPNASAHLRKTSYRNWLYNRDRKNILDETPIASGFA